MNLYASNCPTRPLNLVFPECLSTSVICERRHEVVISATGQLTDLGKPRDWPSLWRTSSSQQNWATLMYCAWFLMAAIKVSENSGYVGKGRPGLLNGTGPYNIGSISCKIQQSSMDAEGQGEYTI